MKLSIKKIPKKVFVALFLTFLLGVSVARASIPGTIMTLAPGFYPGAPAWTIWQENDVYYAKSAAGSYTSGVDVSSIVNTCIAAQTYGGKLLFLYNPEPYVFTAPIVISHSYIVLEGETMNTTLALGNNVNDDLIQVPSTSFDVTIRHLNLWGNNANNVSGNIIHSNSTGLRIETNRISNATENDILLNNTASYAGLHWITGNSIVTALQCGIYADGVFDVFIGQNDIGMNGQSDIFGVGFCSSEIYDNQIWGAILGSGINLTGSIGNSITNNRIDYNKRWGISLCNTNDTVIVGNKIYLNGEETSNTYPGIYIFGGSTYQTLSVEIAHNNFQMDGTKQSRALEVWIDSGKAKWYSVIGNIVIGNLSSPAMYIGNLTESEVYHNVGYP